MAKCSDSRRRGAPVSPPSRGADQVPAVQLGGDTGQLVAHSVVVQPVVHAPPELELLLDDELLEEELVPAGVPNTRHSSMPVDWLVFSIDTRKRLVVMLLMVRVLNAFSTNGTLPRLTQELPFQYSMYAVVGTSTPPLSSNQYTCDEVSV